MIKKIGSTLLALSLSLMAESQAVLKLDTKGHTAIVNKVIITKDKDIITASDDKTIRIYNSKTGIEKRKILGEISPEGGEIYTIALTSDEQYLAAGGYLDKEYGNIRIYNYNSGKLERVVKGAHKNVIYDMDYSKDGSLLITGGGDNVAKIWDANNNYRLKDTIKFHNNDVYGAKLFKKNGRHYAVTASDDNKMALYDIRRKSVVKSYKGSYNFSYIAISDEYIVATGSSKEIRIFDLDLNEIKTIMTKTRQAGVSFSQDGKFLITGTASAPRNVNIYDVDKDFAKKQTFTKHGNLAMGVGFIDNNTAVSIGGSRKELYIWDTNSGKVKRKIMGAGQSVWSVGLRGDTIAWGNRWTANRGKSALEKSMNLKTLSVKKLPKKHDSFNRINTTKGSLTLSHRSGGNYGYNDASLDIKDSGRTLATIVKGSTTGFHHRAYGWYKDFIITAGSSGHLKVYNKKGEEVASLVGHTSEVWGLALEGDRLLSAGGDQTMILWDLSSLNAYSKKATIYPMLNFFISYDDEWVIWSQGGYFNASVGGDKYVGYHINRGYKKEARFVGSDKYFETFYRPDIISLVLKTGSERKAIAYASRTRKVETVEVSKSLPPVVTLTSQNNIRTSSKSTKITFTVESKERVKEIIITQNGKRVTKRGLKKKLSSNTNQESYTIDLDDGQNYIEIKARNAFAMSDSVTIDAFKTSQKKNIFKPTLYMLSIGVSRYKNPQYNLGVADKDAQAMSKLFKGQKGKIYKDVITKTLTNEKATSDNVLDALDWIDKEVTSKDVAMIFIAGHGVNDEKGNYYFLSHDANLDRLRRSAVKWLEIQDTIKNLPSKVILLADTCHSGNITGTRRDITSAIKSITNSGSGSIIMTATTGSGYSYEQKEWGHGAFTKALLDGIGKHKADYDADGSVSIKEIDLYVTNRVKKLTKGKQKPTTIIPDSIPDFAIGVR